MSAWDDPLRECIRTGTPLYPEAVPGARPYLEADRVSAALSDGPIHPSGAHIVGFTIVGRLDLSHQEFSGQIHFVDCRLDAVDAFMSRLEVLRFKSCQFLEELLLIAAEVDWAIVDECFIPGGISARSARVEHDLYVTNCSLGRASKDSPALNLYNASIGGQVIIDVISCGMAILEQARIRSDFQLSGTFVSHHGPSVNADNLGVGGRASVGNEQSTFLGAVRFPYLGCLSLHVLGTYRTHGGQALNFEGATTSGNVSIFGSDIRGECRLMGASIAGQLLVRDSTFRNDAGVAVGLDGLNISGLLSIVDVAVNGEFRLMNLSAGDQVQLQGLHLRVGTHSNLSFDRAEVSGNLSFVGCDFNAPVGMFGIHIGKQLRIHEVRMSSQGDAFQMQQSVVGSEFHIRRLAHERGGMSLRGLRVGGEMAIVDSALSSNPEPRSGTSVFVLEKSVIGGSLLVGRHLDCGMQFAIVDVDIGSEVEFADCQFTDDDGISLLVRDCGIDVFRVTKDVKVAGVFEFVGNDVRLLDEDPEAWTSMGGLLLNSNSAQEFAGVSPGVPSPWSAEVRASWAQLLAKSDPRLVLSLAGEMAESGHQRLARRLRYLIAAGAARGPGRVFWMVGYGYYPERAFLAALAMIVVVLSTAWCAAGSGSLVPLSPAARSGVIPYNPVIHAANVLVPVGAVGNHWQIAAVVPALVFKVTAGLSWVFALLGFASVTGLIDARRVA